MAEPDFGMDKVEFKKLLTMSKKQPVHCGVGMTKDGVVIKLDKFKAGKALTAELQKAHKDMKSPHWGEALVDMDEDPKLVVLMLNKPASGMARKLKKLLKGTGFSKIEIRLEDGTVAEKVGEEDEEGAAPGAAPGAAAANGTAPTAPSAGAAEPSPPDQPAIAEPPVMAAAPPDPAPRAPVEPVPQAPVEPAPAAPDVGAMTRRLTELVKQMIPVMSADPARAATLKRVATQAQASLKSGDLTGAQTLMGALQQALGQAGASPQESPAMTGAPAASAAPTPSPAVAKARLVWVATRQKVQGDLDKLHDAFASSFKGHGRQADLTKAFRTRVDGVLGKLDEALAHKLDAVNKAADSSERVRLVQEAHTLIDGYSRHVASDPTIAEIDRNPFAPLSLRNTITASLTAVSRAIS